MSSAPLELGGQLVGSLVEVVKLSPKQLVMFHDPETLSGHLSDHVVDNAGRRRDRVYGHHFRMAGVPAKVLELNVAFGRLKRGVRVELEYEEARFGRHQLELDEAGNIVYDTFTVEAVVRPSQVLRLWAETELAHAMFLEEREAGVKRRLHWYADCADIRRGDVVSSDHEPQSSGELCRTCTGRARDDEVARRKRRPLRPEQARVLRHLDALEAAGVLDASAARSVREHWLFPENHPGCRPSRDYVLGWLDGRGLT